MKDTAKHAPITPETNLLITECEALSKRIHGFSCEIQHLAQKAFELLKAQLVAELALKEKSLPKFGGN